MKMFSPILMLFLLISTANAQDFKFGKVSIEEVEEKAHPLEKDANAAVLYRYVNTYYDYNKSMGFGLTTDVHERIKIYNKDGFDWASKEISYYRNGTDKESVIKLKANTYNIIGGKLVSEKLDKKSIFVEDRTKYEIITKFAMPAVTEGSVIEYSYSLKSPFVTTIDDMVLQYTIPINRIEASVKIPEFLAFTKHYNPRTPLIFKIDESRKSFSYTSSSIEQGSFRNPGSTMQTSKVEYTQNIYSTNKDNIPSLKKEPHVDHLPNYAAFLKWELQYTKFPNSIINNLSQTWEAVTKSIYTDGGFDKELSSTKYFAKDLDELLEGINEPMAKAHKVFAFAKSKAKWNGYIGYMPESGGSKAYKTGEGNVGDLNLMLISMLKYAGLKANPVILSTKNNGVPLFPTRKGFNYVIAAVEMPGKVILLDATEENASFNELPSRARNWNGRIIRDKETSDWIDLMPREQSKKVATLNLEIGPEQILKGKSTSLLNGLYAKSYRDEYKSINQDMYIEILEKDKGNIQITDLDTEGHMEIGSEIKQTYNFELESGIENINGNLYLKPMLFNAENENPFKADTREYPIIFDFPSLDNRVVNVLVPQGFEVESLPESAIVQLNQGAGTFKFLTSQNGNYLRIESSLDIKNIAYSPTEYDALKKFYAQIVEKHSEAIVLKKI